jgi:N-acyl-D-aspartate/D-glutamate deacylase
MLAFACWSVLLVPALDEPVEADVLIRGAVVVDGSGQAGVVGDVALRGERIVAVGRFTVAGKPKIIEAAGLVVAPGFIDLHTHSDDSLTRPPTNANLAYLLQGVTTVVTGNCGSGPIRVADYFRTLEKGRIGSNVIHLVPHNAVRQAVMRNANRSPTRDELARMVALVDQGMKEGAWGLSTGLIYNPGAYAQTEELITLAKAAAAQGGFYVSHIRGEGVEVLQATEEALKIGRDGGLPVHISHMKASGRKVWGKAGEQIALVEKARKNGQIVTADQYPYTASSTSLAATLIPPRFREGERREFLARLEDAAQRKQIRAAIDAALLEMEGGKAIRIAYYRSKPSWSGQDLVTLAVREDKKAADLVIEIERNGGAQIVNFSMNEEDLRLIMKQPWVATASDGSSRMPDPDMMPHPRTYGCFARKIGRYALEDDFIPLEKAIRSCSGLPADILRLRDRGYLKAGQMADVVVFDPKTFRDKATFEKPQQFAVGMQYVFVNGKLAISAGKATGTLAGVVLRHGKD